MTVPETPSPDQPHDGSFVIKKEHGNIIEGGVRKRHHRMHNNNNQVLSDVSQNGSQAGRERLMVALGLELFAVMRNLWICLLPLERLTFFRMSDGLFISVRRYYTLV
ncbi:hypothetical protein Hdeb2414_s0013g00406641 [Helianthus debilis subsp. tardiflorus]